MRTIWLLVFMTVAIAIYCEAASVNAKPRGVRKGVRRSRGKSPGRRNVRQRMKTTTESPKEEKEEEPEEEKPKDWKKKGGNLTQTDYDLAKDFFIGFDDDNIFEEPDENLIVDEPEVVDFFAFLPEDEEELKEEEMLYIPEKKIPKGTLEKIAYDETKYVQKLFKSQRDTIDCPIKSKPSDIYFTFSDLSWGVHLSLSSSSNYGDLEARFALSGSKEIKIHLNSSSHGWDQDCLKDLKSTNTASKYVIDGVAVCARIHGYIKEMEQSFVHRDTSSVVCMEVQTSKSQFGIIMCVDTPHNRQTPDKVLCCFESVKYTNTKGKMDTVPNVSEKKDVINKCGSEHGPDIKRMLFDVEF